MSDPAGDSIEADHTVSPTAPSSRREVRWSSENRCRIGELEFSTLGEDRDGEDPFLKIFALGTQRSTAEHFIVLKNRSTVDRLAELIRTLAPRQIVELGIFQGGSAALLIELAQPRKLVAIEYETAPVEALADLITSRGLGDRVTPIYGVDQADRARLRGSSSSRSQVLRSISWSTTPRTSSSPLGRRSRCCSQRCGREVST